MKIAFFDLETAPTRGWVWTNYEANLINTDRDWYILSFAYKFAESDRIKTVALPDFPAYKKDKECDKALVEHLWKIFDEADILVAHNGDAFDIKKANARFIAHGLSPPSPYRTVDTLKLARKHFKFGSNKLNDLSQYLKIGGKLPHTGAHLWFSCMTGDAKAWRIMKRYNAQDVRLLEKVYHKLRPWASNHPNLNLYTGKDNCPSCQSPKVQRRGVMVKLQTRKARFHCQSCGHWFSAKLENASKLSPTISRSARTIGRLAGSSKKANSAGKRTSPSTI